MVLPAFLLRGLRNVEPALLLGTGNFNALGITIIVSVRAKGAGPPRKICEAKRVNLFCVAKSWDGTRGNGIN